MQDRETLYKSLGSKIRSLREVKGMSLQVLAEKSGLGLGKASIVNIEQGRQQVTVYQLYCFALALDVRMETLLSEILEDNYWQSASGRVVALSGSKMRQFENTFRKY